MYMFSILYYSSSILQCISLFSILYSQFPFPNSKFSIRYSLFCAVMICKFLFWTFFFGNFVSDRLTRVIRCTSYNSTIVRRLQMDFVLLSSK